MSDASTPERHSRQLAANSASDERGVPPLTADSSIRAKDSHSVVLADRDVRDNRKPPVPSSDRSPESKTDPKTENARTKDVREEFARITEQVGRDAEAERAFVENKVEMIRSHPRMSEAEKEAAIAELQEALKGEP
jgi:hypothetical protein